MGKALLFLVTLHKPHLIKASQSVIVLSLIHLFSLSDYLTREDKTEP